MYAYNKMHTCSCSSARRFALSSSESELGLLSLSSLSLLSSLSDDDEEEEDEEDELGGAGGSSGILAKQNSKTSCKRKQKRSEPDGKKQHWCSLFIGKSGE